jgi:hypothetical protein
MPFVLLIFIQLLKNWGTDVNFEGDQNEDQDTKNEINDEFTLKSLSSAVLADRSRYLPLKISITTRLNSGR